MMRQTPKWLMPVAVAALLWNLMGCAAYLMDAMATAEDIAKLSAAEQAMYAARPGWSVAGTAVGVWAGALGCLGLIFRKRWALPVLILSLLGVIVQDIWMFGISAEGRASGSTIISLQALVLVVAVALVWLARTASQKGWLR
jgi:hypothetical protein